MLVDKYALTKSFNRLILHHNPSGEAQAQPPASFVRRVESCMNRMDPLLKTLQVRAVPPEGLVQAYLIHIGDRSEVNFRKVLELKGVRKQDHSHLVELFGIHRDSGSNGQLVASSPLLTPLMNPAAAAAAAAAASNNNNSSSGHGGGGGSISAAPLFDTGSLGEKLLSAARDIGTAADRTTAGPSGAEKATMNENLRNFGRFFKRDIGGLGARFGMRDGSEDGR